MLTLSRKQMTVLFIILVSFVVAMIATMTVLHASNPEMWKQVLQLVPDYVNRF